MKPIKAQFEIVQVENEVFDVLVFSRLSVLKAFQNAYPETIFIEKSKFNGVPMLAVPSFDSNFKARAWVGYWEEALSDPEKACKSCEIVQFFFKLVGDFDNEIADKE